MGASRYVVVGLLRKARDCEGASMFNTNTPVLMLAFVLAVDSNALNYGNEWRTLVLQDRGR